MSHLTSTSPTHHHRRRRRRRHHHTPVSISDEPFSTFFIRISYYTRAHTASLACIFIFVFILPMNVAPSCHATEESPRFA